MTVQFLGYIEAFHHFQAHFLLYDFIKIIENNWIDNASTQ